MLTGLPRELRRSAVGAATPGVSGGSLRVANYVAKKNVYALALYRKMHGLPAAGSADDRHTVAMIEIEGRKFFGRNAHGRAIQGVNAMSRDHAEIDPRSIGWQSD